MGPLLAWLLTYMIHSTLLLGAAAVVRLALRERHLGLQEAVIRAAVVGGFVTASLQVGLGLQPLGGVVRMAVTPPPAPAVETAEIVYGALPAVLEEVRTKDAGAPGAPSRAPLAPPSHVWVPALVASWAALAVLALVRLGVAAARLKKLLRPRHRLGSEDLLARLAALAAGLGLRRPVPVSTAPRLEVPLATGVLHPEVCLPTRALAELAADQQEALCAHELAHVARRDPAWILLARLIEALAPLQPLNTWARRRLQDVAECLSDDLAVAASGRPEGLARSLVDVASWTVVEAVPFPAAAAGAVSSRSRLGHRVERLMNPLRSLERPGRLLLPLAAAAVLATALVTPAVSGSSTDADAPVAPTAPAPLAAPLAPAPPSAPEPPDPPQAPEAPPAPEAPQRSASDAERRLEELMARIEERTQKLEGMEELEAEIEKVTQSIVAPQEEEIERLSAELEEAARTVAEASVREHEGQSPDVSPEELAEARRAMEEKKEEIRKVAESIQIPAEELRRLGEKARAIGEAARLTAEEEAEIHRLAEEIARESQPEIEKMREELKDISRTMSRETMSALRESMRTMRETMRTSLRMARAEGRAVQAEARDAQREALSAARQARAVAREDSDEGGEETRSLEEAEQSHLSQAEETP